MAKEMGSEKTAKALLINPSNVEIDGIALICCMIGASTAVY